MDDGTYQSAQRRPRESLRERDEDRTGTDPERTANRWHLEVEHHLSSVPLARHWVVQRCAAAQVPPGALTVVELLTAELTANAVLHGRAPVRVDLERTATGVRVAVGDAEKTPPVRRTVGPEATGGRGVALVDLLSSAWGVEQVAGGKTVWFTLDLPGS
ncbi:ATP-binding protein [Paenibacillus sp. TRM 82003]|uniref:ATP-binding protein n=1 Tax=Kineococcus sp. TRM81007 TaxID=2925831 RepID=UPI001F57C57C|nr:ATP-binding protein [Kineococcus sp. TRM81007]MCI2238169.1 ATP-binding protein [Kineococcus sp. TRM81007]MCI3920553.1 ATP-binding protein [Paenibacillus sp. TRM 82003]